MTNRVPTQRDVNWINFLDEEVDKYHHIDNSGSWDTDEYAAGLMKNGNLFYGYISECSCGDGTGTVFEYRDREDLKRGIYDDISKVYADELVRELEKL